MLLKHSVQASSTSACRCCVCASVGDNESAWFSVSQSLDSLSVASSRSCEPSRATKKLLISSTCQQLKHKGNIRKHTCQSPPAVSPPSSAAAIFARSQHPLQLSFWLVLLRWLHIRLASQPGVLRSPFFSVLVAISRLLIRTACSHYRPIGFQLHHRAAIWDDNENKLIIPLGH